MYISLYKVCIIILFTFFNVNQGVRIDVDEEAPYTKGSSGEPGSRVANPSIGELSLGASLSMGSGSHLDR